ncbi:hypothetical protein CDO73_10215 [Saccharibacillus sp. O23]|uniref:hypothetical protein n=1 Tax=Saccharibacillus sp. O23 TaxID=2009338 RepID=UPI000B4E0B30|nr:hypothetical protein [Saccharibacillus sp. O23]OWR30949.1 hypothetical protein CDO73_10215 [Saccharibacillus sp. O23]
MKLHTATRAPAGSAPWIRDKKRFRLAMILTTVLTLLSIRYPGVRPLYEEALRALHLPLAIPLFGKAHIVYPGLIFTGFALWTLYLIWDSLNRHRIIFCILLLWLLPILGKAALAGYQALIPPGVYAVSADQEQQACSVTLEKGLATGDCSFVVTNYGSKPVELQSSVAFDIDLSGKETHTLTVPLRDTRISPRGIEVIGGSFSQKFDELGDLSGTLSWGNNALESDTFKLTVSDGSRERVWGD